MILLRYREQTDVNREAEMDPEVRVTLNRHYVSDESEILA